MILSVPTVSAYWSELEKISSAITPKDIHRRADRLGIVWDSEKPGSQAFLNLSKRVTGKTHLDKMTPAELSKVYGALEKTAAQRVRGYTRKDGTRVKGYTRGKTKRIDHVGKRAKERAPGTEAEISQLRRKLPSLTLRRGDTYFYELANGSYAVVGDVGKTKRHHVVKTVLGRYMRPPGTPLGRVLKEKTVSGASK